MGDVWKLETKEQDLASDYINTTFEDAVNGSVSKRNWLKKLYGNDWETIKERMNTEGSVWYVWYMDGVNKLLFRANQDRVQKII